MSRTLIAFVGVGVVLALLQIGFSEAQVLKVTEPDADGLISVPGTGSLLVDPDAYRNRDPRRGELVAVGAPGQGPVRFVRVFALPGEEVAIWNGLIFIDGQPSGQTSVSDNTSPFTVPANLYLVGDETGDVLSFICIPKEQIWGKVLVAQ